MHTLSDALWELVWLLPLAVLAAGLVTVIWWALGGGSRKRIRGGARARQLAELRQNGAYWAVMVRPDTRGTCEHARAVQRRVYSLHQAPPLPFDGCRRSGCQCRYVGLRERRRRDVLPPGIEDRRAGARVRWYRPVAHEPVMPAGPDRDFAPRVGAA
jgi:hypothetical protein